MTRDYFDVTHDPTGWVDPETGERSAMWSSCDVRPAQSLGHLMAHALEQGYGTSTKFKLPDAEEPDTLGNLYQKAFGKYPRNYLAFQREAKIRDHVTSNRDPYGTGLPDAALGGGKRSDYGTTKRIDET